MPNAMYASQENNQAGLYADTIDLVYISSTSSVAELTTGRKVTEQSLGTFQRIKESKILVLDIKRYKIKI